jgi:hypothetical protein
MNRQATMHSIWARGALIATLVVLAVAGFCLFDGNQDSDHHAGSLHVCLAMAVTGLMPAAVAALLATGNAVGLTPPSVAAVALAVVLPPPKSFISL